MSRVVSAGLVKEGNTARRRRPANPIPLTSAGSGSESGTVVTERALSPATAARACPAVALFNNIAISDWTRVWHGSQGVKGGGRQEADHFPWVEDAQAPIAKRCASCRLVHEKKTMCVVRCRWWSLRRRLVHEKNDPSRKDAPVSIHDPDGACSGSTMGMEDNCAPVAAAAPPPSSEAQIPIGMSFSGPQRKSQRRRLRTSLKKNSVVSISRDRCGSRRRRRVVRVFPRQRSRVDRVCSVRVTTTCMRNSAEIKALFLSSSNKVAKCLYYES